MTLPRKTFLHLAASAAVCPFVFGLARAEDYPTRPITVIVPFAAGGPLDTLTRIVADRMREFLGQPVVVENVTGAAGTIGVGRVAHAAPDGYTLIAGIWSTHVINGAVYKLSYDVLNDFAAHSECRNCSADTGAPVGRTSRLGLSSIFIAPDQGTRGPARCLVSTLGGTIVMTRLASGPRHFVEALAFKVPAHRGHTDSTLWALISTKHVSAIATVTKSLRGVPPSDEECHSPKRRVPLGTPVHRVQR